MAALMWTTALAALIALPLTLPGFLVHARTLQMWLSPAHWVRFYANNLVIALFIGLSVHALLVLGATLVGRARVLRMAPWQRALYCAALSSAGVLIGWPLRRTLDTEPLEGPALAGALRRLLGSQSRSQPPLKYIRASAGEITHQVDVNDVLFFQSDEKYTCVHTALAEHLIRTPIHDLAQQLDPDAFWQVHRSTLINLRFLAGTRRDDTSRLWLRLKGHAHELPVSRAYVHLFKAM